MGGNEERPDKIYICSCGGRIHLPGEEDSDGVWVEAFCPECGLDWENEELDRFLKEDE
jgi:hypothetical protein